MPLNYQEVTLDRYDPSSLLQVLNSTELAHRIIGRSEDLSVTQRRLTLGNCVINHVDYDFPVLIRGSFPGSVACVALRTSLNADIRDNYQQVPLNQIQLFASEKEFEYAANTRAGWIAMEFPMQALQEAADTYFGFDLDWPKQGIRHLDLSPQDGAQLRRELNNIITIGKEYSERGHKGQLSSVLLGESLIQIVVRAIVKGSPNLTKGISSSQQHALYSLEAGIQQCLQESDNNLCKVHHMIDSTQRTLERATQNVYGMTPNRWIKLARLNAAHSDLLCGSSVSVTAVAERWGFHHKGRFAQEYRELFGHSPRQTLQKHYQ